MMDKSDWIHLEPKRRNFPLRFQEDLDQSARTGFVLFVLAVIAIAAAVWYAH
jgi:hypothetical protein